MTAKGSESYLFAYRREGPNEPPIEKAAKLSERDADASRRLQEQVSFDRQMTRAVHAIALPAGLREKLSASDPRRVKGRPFIIPLLVAVLCGFSVIVGLLVFYEIDRRERYPGSEAVARIINSTKNMSGLELERINNKAGQLGDWFYMRGFEHYAIPRELAEAPAVGSRIFRQDGNPVAQIAVDWHDCVIYTFRADEFGVILPEDEDWRLRQYEDWVAAIRKRGGICTLVTFRGGKAEMRDFLEKLAKK